VVGVDNLNQIERCGLSKKKKKTGGCGGMKPFRIKPCKSVRIRTAVFFFFRKATEDLQGWWRISSLGLGFEINGWFGR
jgi:hypothetical protein